MSVLAAHMPNLSARWQTTLPEIRLLSRSTGWKRRTRAKSPHSMGPNPAFVCVDVRSRREKVLRGQARKLSGFRSRHLERWSFSSPKLSVTIQSQLLRVCGIL